MKALFLFLMVLLTNCATLHTQSCDQFCGYKNQVCEKDGVVEYKAELKEMRKKFSSVCLGEAECKRNKAAKDAYFKKLVMSDKLTYSLYQCRDPKDRFEANFAYDKGGEVHEIEQQSQKEAFWVNEVFKWAKWFAI